MKDPNETVCEKANRLVSGERQWSYAHPWDNCSRIAQIWSVILGKEIQPRQVAMCMIGVKLAREVHAHADDNLVDIAGYAQVAALAQEPPVQASFPIEEEPPTEWDKQYDPNMRYWENVANKNDPTERTSAA